MKGWISVITEDHALADVALFWLIAALLGAGLALVAMAK